MIEILKALADETRMRILAQVLKGDICVCEIENCLSLSQSNASRHLTVLKKAGILESYKSAQWTYYKISETFIKENFDLYNYLIIKTKSIPSYELDSNNYKSCKEKHICNCCK